MKAEGHNSKRKRRPPKKRKTPTERKKLATQLPIEKRRVSRKRKIRRENKRKKYQKMMGELLMALVLFFGILWGVGLVAFTVTKNEGFAMNPVLADGDRLFINKLGTIKRFDLISFEAPETKEKRIRRVIGLPGEEISYKEGKLFVNGEEKVERFLGQSLAEEQTSGVSFTEDFSIYSLIKESKIPKNQYLVLGDNRPYATDSRY